MHGSWSNSDRDSVATAGDIDELFHRFRDRRSREDRDELVLRHRWIAHYCAKRFAGRGEPLEDLVQVGQLGLVKAVERYDPTYGVDFPGFAIPTVTGELRRHFRDATWTVHVGRRPKDLSVALRHAVDALQQRLGRAPTVEEVAAELRVTQDDVLMVMEALEANRTRPLQTILDDDSDDRATVRAHGHEDERLDVVRLSVRRALEQLPPRDRTILILRFYEGMTQAEIAERLGSSQVQVSRELRRIFRRLAVYQDLAG